MAIIRRKQIRTDKPEQEQMTNGEFPFDPAAGNGYDQDDTKNDDAGRSDQPDYGREVLRPTNGGSGEEGLDGPAAEDPVSGAGAPPKKRRKIRVELIKESSGDEEEENGSFEAGEGAENENAEETAATETMEGGQGGAQHNDERRSNRSRGNRKNRGDSGPREKLSINHLTRMNLPPLRTFAVRPR